MRKLISCLIVFSLIPLISGCIPMGGNYYYPSNAKGTVTGEYCSGSSGAMNTLNMRIGQMSLRITADTADGAHKIRINITAAGDADLVSKIKLDDVSVFDEDDELVLEKKNAMHNYHSYKNINSASFAYWFFIDASPNKFNVSLPTINIDGKSYENITIQFTKKFGMWIGLINC
jgi:hypothetical protein